MSVRPAPINYYDLLQINPRAEPEAVERVFRMLAARYEPGRETADPERLNLLREAYETLIDPQRRARYDAELEQGQASPLSIFQGKEFTDGIDAEARIRIGVLCLLYSKRRANPDFAALSLLDMENLMAFPRERLLFAIWYLRAKRYIMQDDRSSFIITAEGVDFLESQLPTNQILYKIFRASESGVMVYPKALSGKIG
ncbi:MAG TPA: DnaJ domain-containing protein [Bryobacteraceae bacterium]|nr:DnaJ domain-containing protein [Bryobacteraceae bacterium]